MRRFNNSSIFWLTLLLLAMLALPTLAQRRYTITAIGPLPGDARSTATAINESGKIAGISFNDVYQGAFYSFWPPFADTMMGFVWDRGTVAPLLPPAGYQGTWCIGLHAINAKGQVVGTAAMVDPDLPSPPDWNGHPLVVGKVPVLWNKPDEPQILPIPAGMTHAAAWAINNRGQVIGQAGVDLGLFNAPEYWTNGISEVAVLWNKNQPPTILPTLFPGGKSGASIINDNGQILGISVTADGSTAHPYLWERGQVIDLIPNAPGFSDATGLNNRGQAVGYTDLFGRAYLWDKGVLTDLGVVEDDAYSYAIAINNKGQVVGFSSGGPLDETIGRGFLWENGVMHDLNALFDDPGDIWHLSWAYSINDKEEIVGFGFRKNTSGDYIATGFLLTPKKK